MRLVAQVWLTWVGVLIAVLLMGVAAAISKDERPDSRLDQFFAIAGPLFLASAGITAAGALLWVAWWSQKL